MLARFVARVARARALVATCGGMRTPTRAPDD